MEETILDITVKGIRPLLQNAFSSETDGKKLLKRGKLYDDEFETNSRLIKNDDGIKVNVSMPDNSNTEKLVKRTF